MSSIMAVTVDTFEKIVLEEQNKPVLVDFWAEWCGPCRSLAPILEELASELGDQAKIVKVNVDDNGDIAQKYGIRGIPTMIFFKGGQNAKTLVGVQSKEELKKALEELI